MNKLKFTVFIVIILLFVNTLSLAYGAEAPQYQEEANRLSVLSIFKGTDKGFELERPPTRVEAGIVFVRLMGGEAEALDKKYPHPFTDVPKWGRDYVGFLYHHNLVKGISENKFGSRNIIKAPAYMTMALRSLGYQDDGQDFKWRKSLEKALEINLIDQDFYDDLIKAEFLRDHVAKISYDLLKQPVKDSQDTLAEKLLSYGTFTKEILDELNLLEPIVPAEPIEPEDPLVAEPDEDIPPVEPDGQPEEQ